MATSLLDGCCSELGKCNERSTKLYVKSTNIKEGDLRGTQQKRLALLTTTAGPFLLTLLARHIEDRKDCRSLFAIADLYTFVEVKQFGHTTWEEKRQPECHVTLTTKVDPGIRRWL